MPAKTDEQMDKLLGESKQSILVIFIILDLKRRTPKKSGLKTLIVIRKIRTGAQIKIGNENLNQTIVQ